MLGLAVLFGLGLWLLVTIVAMVIGAKFGRKPATKLLGAFLGFMLTMGGFIVHWTVEYYQIQRTVTHLCETEGGITVYVTPEEWRKQIGEEEWEKLTPYTWGEQMNYPKESITFNGREYNPAGQYNDRLVIYTMDKQTRSYILEYYSLYYDIKSGSPIFTANSFNTGVKAIANNIDGLKFWINDIQSCDFTSRQSKILNQYRNTGENNE